MIEKTALAVKAAGTRSRWETGKLWGYLKRRKVALAANAAVFVPLVAVGFWVYLVQDRSIGKLRRTNESLAEQIAKKGSGGTNHLKRPRRPAAAVAEGSPASSSR